MSFFCKSSLSKMASVKTNKTKNRTALYKTNFLRHTTHSCPELSLRLEKVQDIRPLYHDSVVFWVLEKEGFKIF